MPALVTSELRAPATGPAGGVLGDVLRRAVELGPDDVLLTTPATGESWSAARLLADATSLATGLLQLAGPGARVATCLANGPAPVLVQLGVALAGQTLVPVNPRSRPAEVEHALTLAGARVAVADGPGAEFCAAVPGVQVVADWRSLLAPPGALPEVAPDSLAQVQFTSGTTGRAKGVRITHAGMVATGAAFADRLGPTAGRVWCNPMPLFHTAGNVLGVVGALWARADHVVLPFAPGPVLEVLASSRVTMLSAAPTLLDLLVSEGVPDLPDLAVLFTGGMTVTPAFVDRVEAAFGARLATTFGMTETCGSALMTGPGDPDEVRRGTVGGPLAGTEVRICGPDGVPVPVGEPGELWVRGARLTDGYLADPPVPALDDEGWLHTGDLAEMSASGACRVVGRLKDIIKSGGENVSPVEVEEALAAHPADALAAVGGAPDERWGELVVGFVVPAGADVDVAELEAWCRDRLSPFKVPRRWHLVDELPMTASAKVQRAELRRRAAT
ncbi:linear/branched/unsaturated fatty acid:CoA ligase LbuL [Klenkia terrae]